MMSKFKTQPSFSRKLRFRYGELAWSAIGGFLGQLRWPKSDDTHGVTWCELALFFELATGLILPRSAKHCQELFGSRDSGRQAEWADSHHVPSQHSFLEHEAAKIIDKKKIRWKCNVCTRECAYSDKSKFLRHSCAGYPETPVQAMRRHKLAKAAEKRVNQAEASPATLAEKAVVMSDLVRATAKFYQGCCSELEACASELPARLLHSDSSATLKAASWASRWTLYRIARPASMWRPPPDPG